MNNQNNVLCPTNGKDDGCSPDNRPPDSAISPEDAQRVTQPPPDPGEKIPTGTNCAHLGCP